MALDKTYQKFVKYLNELKIRAEKKKEAQENLKLTQASEISIRDEETRRLQLKFINTQIQHHGSSTADELLKLKTLIDSGALTLEEYNESPQSKPNIARCNV